MRDYTQPHPYAIFKDKPTRFIEVYRHHSMGLVVNSPNLISRLEYCLQNTSICGHQTIALFIIKPRKHPLSPSQWGDRLNQLNKR